MKVKFKRYHYCPICGKRRRISDAEKEDVARRIAESPYKATSVFCNNKPNLHSTCKTLILVKGVIE